MARTLIAVSVLLALIVLGATAVEKLLPGFSELPPISTSCTNEYGSLLTYNAGETISPGFASCVQRHADLFLSRDLPESKDLAKSFLTLLTAVLVASITFSEKIVDIGRADWFPRVLMVSCWVCILSAIVACGIGLAYITVAGGFAAYSPFVEYCMFEVSAVRLFVVAGLAFCLGLTSLLTAGVFSLRTVTRARTPLA